MSYEETIEHFKLTSNEAIALGDKIIKMTNLL